MAVAMLIGLPGCQAMDKGEQLESLEKTVLRVGGRDETVTRADAKAIQAALLEHLRTSSYSDREELIRWTQGPSWIDVDGIVRIGPWVLGSEGTQMFLRYREVAGQHAFQAHKAYLARRDGSWSVSELLHERIPAKR